MEIPGIIPPIYYSWIFLKTGEKNLRFPKNPDTCGRSLIQTPNLSLLQNFHFKFGTWRHEREAWPFTPEFLVYKTVPEPFLPVIKQRSVFIRVFIERGRQHLQEWHRTIRLIVEF